MKQRFIKKEGNSTLLLFFAGWGSDENLFSGPVQEECDCLLCFDYKDLDFDYSLLEGYREIRVALRAMIPDQGPARHWPEKNILMG